MRHRAIVGRKLAGMNGKRIISAGTNDPVRLLEWLKREGLADQQEIELRGVEIIRTREGIYYITEKRTEPA